MRGFGLAIRCPLLAASVTLLLLAVGCTDDVTPPAGKDGAADVVSVDLTAPDTGLVCSGGSTECGGKCVDTQSDTTNCGGCGKACSSGMVCVKGSCETSCGSGTIKCGQSCVDPKTDEKNCGTCGTACTSGETCTGGKCALWCPSPFSDCSGTCVDTKTDEKNCGACGTACKATEACVASKCSLWCPSPYVNCGGSCVDLKTSFDNCGACTTPCKTGQSCAKGTCQPFPCSAGLTNCAGACVDTQKDHGNCGACAAACKAGQTCEKGACATYCPLPFTLCSGACVDTTNNKANCGACGSACKAGELCAAGKCSLWCPPTMTDCSGACVDTQSHKKNCGACGTACLANQLCDKGKCVLWCPSPFTDCSGACVDTQTDKSYCGNCTTACKAGEECVLGKCGVVCTGSQSLCSGKCVDLSLDAANCGKCGTKCSGAAFICCTSKCADPLTDKANCGGCGVTCLAKQSCKNGKCVNKATTCASILAADSTAKSGVYTITPAGSSTPISVYCDMTTGGGGWTLIATTADDHTNPWTGANKAYLWNTKTFGTVQNRTKDFKSEAYSLVLFTDMMFLDKQGMYGVYAKVGQGTKTVKDWMPQTLACRTTAGRVFQMTAGNLKTKANTASYMQNTAVYFSITDYDGCACKNEDDAYGPTWAYKNNANCWPDDPGCLGWGPGPGVNNDEQGYARLGTKLCMHKESNNGDYIQWFVR